MSNKLFKNIPDIQYKLNDKLVTVKDYFRKAKIDSAKLDSIIEYELYDLGDGERPDVLATKLYGDGDLHWVFFLVNEIDNYYDWYKDSETFNNYIFLLENGWKQPSRHKHHHERHVRHKIHANVYYLERPNMLLHVHKNFLQ